MQVREIMISDVKTIEKDATIQEAAEVMSKHGIGSLIVTEDSRVIGIVTERDILIKVVSESKDATKTYVKDIMTKEVIMINTHVMIDKIMLRDTFLTDIETPVKKAIALIIVWVICLLGLTVTFLLAARIILLAFLFFCAMINYVPSIPFLTG